MIFFSWVFHLFLKYHTFHNFLLFGIDLESLHDCRIKSSIDVRSCCAEVVFRCCSKSCEMWRKKSEIKCIVVFTRRVVKSFNIFLFLNLTRAEFPYLNDVFHVSWSNYNISNKNLNVKLLSSFNMDQIINQIIFLGSK